MSTQYGATANLSNDGQDRDRILATRPNWIEIYLKYLVEIGPNQGVNLGEIEA